MILSRREVAPVRIFFSRFSRRRRACRWAGDSCGSSIVEGLAL